MPLAGAPGDQTKKHAAITAGRSINKNHARCTRLCFGHIKKMDHILTRPKHPYENRTATNHGLRYVSNVSFFVLYIIEETRIFKIKKKNFKKYVVYIVHIGYSKTINRTHQRKRGKRDDETWQTQLYSFKCHDGWRFRNLTFTTDHLYRFNIELKK